MLETIRNSQENDRKGRPLVPRQTNNLYQGVQGNIASHLLIDHVPDWLIMGEICYQTILQGYNATLFKDKKRDFIPYEFHVGFYIVKETTQYKKEKLIQIEFRYPTC
jgi:hypothetical protein